MLLVVLGSGTSVPHPQRASAAFWLETDGGSMLLDCSADAMHRMAQEPRRLVKRYVVEDLPFAVEMAGAVLREKRNQRR